MIFFAIGVTLALLMLVAAVVGLTLKLCFALFTGIFGLVASLVGLLFGGVMLVLMVLMVPFSLLCLAPVGLPLVLLIAVAWVIGRAGRTPAVRPDVRGA